MAQQENSNSFALLVDEEVDDDSTFLDRVAEKVKTSLPEEEKRQKQIQSGSVNGERSRGRGDQGYGPGRFGHGRNEVGQFGNGHANRYEQNRRGSNVQYRNYREGNGYGGSNSYQRNYGGANGYQFENGAKNSYQHNNGGEYANKQNYGGEDGNKHNYGGEDGYRHNYGGENGNRYGGMNGSQRNYRGDSNYGGDSARNAGYHNGNGRGRGSGSDENNVSGNEVEALSSQQNPIQDGAKGSGREQVIEVQRNGRSGNDRRGYGGGNSNYRGQEGNYYGGRSGSNRRGEFFNNSETKEGVEKEHAISGDNSGKAERNPPLPTDVDKDAKPKQGKHENDDSSEKAREREREERAREREEKAREREEEEKKMTLGQYEKQLCEKRKALEAMKNSAERIVNVDKDFESMKLVEKKKEDSLFIKLDSDEKDKAKKKAIIAKEEKVRKSVSIHEFLKPASDRGRGGRGGRGRGERGGFRGSFPRQQGRGDTTPALEDVPSPTLEYAHQFPTLGSAVKA